MNYRIGIVAGIKNDVEMVEPFIEHHLKLGFTKIHLMDFNSTDGTKDILLRYQNHPQVEVELSPYNHGVPILQQQLRLRAYRDPDIDYLFYLDLDEFVVIAPNHSLQSVLNETPSPCYYIDRFNIVLPHAIKQGLSDNILNNLHRCAYYTPYSMESIISYPILPEVTWREWIQNQTISGKILHQITSQGVQVNLGGHLAFGPTITEALMPSNIFIAHIPVSTYSRMIQKLESYQSLIDENPTVFQGFIPRYYYLCWAHREGYTQQMYNALSPTKELLRHLVQQEYVQKGDRLFSPISKKIQLGLLPFDRSHILSHKMSVKA